MGRLNLSELLIPAKERINFEDKIGLVLSGGGARGAYQIGVWKALKDCGIEIGGVYGTSVGALNSMAVAMDKFEDARELWLKIDFDKIVIDGTDGSLIEKAIGALKSGGFDPAPLRKNFGRLLKEEDVRKAVVDIGIVTYSLSNMEPRELFIEDIPKGELEDYILASANHPVFKREQIGLEKFIDGGIYRNIPVNMALGRGFKEIIIVDLGPKRIRDVLTLASLKRLEEVKHLVIKPREFYGDVLDFDPEVSRDFMKEGYLDCLSELGYLAGEEYYVFAKQDTIAKALFTMPEKKRKEAKAIFGIEPWQSESTYHFYYGQLVPVLQNHFGTTSPLETWVVLLDKLAGLMELEKLELFSLQTLIERITSAVRSSIENIEYNDISCQRVMSFLEFLINNSNMKDLEDQEFKKFEDGFSSLTRLE
ncbi:MAG: patatin-like phospholipase family protein [Mesotoga sp.]|uniref:patatin-like phospholipase family protein n=1 Tax=Mesotoga sp. TaxID=2053577 RepID=UPI00261BA984|nr:patatin-like phospholipase family protein [Mesotoga sp.]MDD4826156.1 patatin-like phospholipase family protein [Mesotoga sp.]MDI9367454.1 patatin-like phospholipase family protein [Thermotogota bacterium]